MLVMQAIAPLVEFAVDSLNMALVNASHLHISVLQDNMKHQPRHRWPSRRLSRRADGAEAELMKVLQRRRRVMAENCTEEKGERFSSISCCNSVLCSQNRCINNVLQTCLR